MAGNEAEYIEIMRPQKKLLQTMGDFKTGLDASKINTTTENFIKNKHGVHITEKIHTTMNRTRRKKGEDGGQGYGAHAKGQRATPLQLGRQAYHQQIVGYDSNSDSSYVHIPKFKMNVQE